MTNTKIPTIQGGSAEYWRQRKEAFRLIREAERAAERIRGEPMYIAGNWDEEYGDYEPVENLAPFDALDDALGLLYANETAVGILVAQKRTEMHGITLHRIVDLLDPFDPYDDPEIRMEAEMNGVRFDD